MLAHPLAAALVVLATSSAISQERLTEIVHREPGPALNSDLRRCAAFDLHVLWLVEEHGDAQEISGDEIAAVTEQMVNARRLCSAGQTGEALEVYSTIALTRPRSRWFR